MQKIKIKVFYLLPNILNLIFKKKLLRASVSLIAYCLLPLALLFNFAADAQVVNDSVFFKYPFIVIDTNKLSNNSTTLQSFYKKLLLLEETKKEKINVVHIGDSHLQADHFSGRLRQNFQHNFGNAGRGFIFPYRVARTNEPSSYKTSTNIVWDAKRNVFPEKPLPIGIGGITIETSDTAAEIRLTVKDQVGINYSFNKLTLYHAKSETNFDFAIYDSLYNEIAYVNNLTDTMNKYYSELQFDKFYRSVVIKSCPRNSSQSCAQIYGLLLENDSAGILYHMIGVNGAEFRHYNLSQYFIEQLPLLKPDLIIVSLGTNEGYTTAFDTTKFYNDIDSLITSIKRTNPTVDLLLTTPGDSFRRTRKGRVKNPDMLDARNTLIKYCNTNNLAYWDLYAVMGGYGSMFDWYKAHLSSKDKLHFSGRGYAIQADLLYSAIIKNYTKYKNNVNQE